MPAKGAVGGLFAGIALAFWAGTGSFIYPAPPTKSLPLPLSTLNCTLANSTEALTTAAPTAAPARYHPCPRLYPTLRHGAQPDAAACLGRSQRPPSGLGAQRTARPHSQCPASCVLMARPRDNINASVGHA